MFDVEIYKRDFFFKILFGVENNMTSFQGIV